MLFFVALLLPFLCVPEYSELEKVTLLIHMSLVAEAYIIWILSL